MIRRILRRFKEVVKEEWEWMKFRVWMKRRAVRWAR